MAISETYRKPILNGNFRRKSAAQRLQERTAAWWLSREIRRRHSNLLGSALERPAVLFHGAAFEVAAFGSGVLMSATASHLPSDCLRQTVT